MTRNITPGMPEAVVQPTGDIEIVNGRPTLGLNITVSPEVFEQYRQGYRCLACHHGPQPEPFPEHCCEPYCRFPMRRDQARMIELQMKGYEELWPDEEPLDEERLRHDHLRSQGLWLPDRPL